MEQLGRREVKRQMSFGVSGYESHDDLKGGGRREEERVVGGWGVRCEGIHLIIKVKQKNRFLEFVRSMTARRMCMPGVD